eukprot:NODE_844_length_3569_cov_0.506052.p1 type:complete len:512 gc:universal NODE_844_length_3569_cov_0.506052:1725-3260(+)
MLRLISILVVLLAVYYFTPSSTQKQTRSPVPPSLVCKNAPIYQHSLAGQQDTFNFITGVANVGTKSPYFIEIYPYTPNTQITVSKSVNAIYSGYLLATLPEAPESTSLQSLLAKTPSYSYSPSSTLEFNEHPGTVEICDTLDNINNYQPVDANIQVEASTCDSGYNIPFVTTSISNAHGNLYQFEIQSETPLQLNLAFTTNAFTSIFVYFNDQVYQQPMDGSQPIILQGTGQVDIAISSQLGMGHFILNSVTACPINQLNPRTDVFKDHKCATIPTTQFIYYPTGQTVKSTITETIYQLPFTNIQFPANTIFNSGKSELFGHFQVSITHNPIIASILIISVFNRQSDDISICTDGNILNQLLNQLNSINSGENPSNCKSLTATLAEIPYLYNPVLFNGYSDQKYQLNELINMSSIFSISTNTPMSYYLGQAYANFLGGYSTRAAVLGFNSIQMVHSFNKIQVNSDVVKLENVQLYFDEDPGTVTYCSTNDYKISFIKVILTNLGDREWDDK